MNILKPDGYVDVAYYYSKIAPKLKRFLKNKEIATKIYLPYGLPTILKRGSKEEPLYIQEFIHGVNKKFLDCRKKYRKLADARNKLTKEQTKVWDYFVPRKLIEFLYATNKEGPGKDLDRIYFDIDKKDLSAINSQEVAKKLLEVIRQDNNFKIKYKDFVLWTGNSFHVYLLLNKKVSHDFYEKNIHFNPKKPVESFTGRWVEKIKKQVNFNVIAGHEKVSKNINIDPSQSPSGKMARAPFSLYVRDPKNISGISIPLKYKDLSNKNLINELKSYTPEKVISELNKLAKNIP
ncbi:MAG: hypothetical protein V1815_02005 [Candidatus Woesearchaeota archaeon]